MDIQGESKNVLNQTLCFLRRVGAALGIAAYDPVPRLKSGVSPVSLPLPADEVLGWKAYPVLKGSTERVYELACHVSVLVQDASPHPPHAHEEEEVLLLLSGEVDLIFPAAGHDGNFFSTRLSPGELVYYPAWHSHSLRTSGAQPAQYLMLKWTTNAPRSEEPLEFGRYPLFEEKAKDETGFCPRVLFEGPTDYLRKIQCHSSTLSPGAGYEPHADPYDVVIVVLEGEVATLGRMVKPHGVIFYRAGEPHGMSNRGTKTARYVVVELHARLRPVNIFLKLTKALFSQTRPPRGQEA